MGIGDGEDTPRGRARRARGTVRAMKVSQETLEVATRGRGLYDVTPQVRTVVERSGARAGVCTVFVQHTSASLVVQENADPAVLRDLERWISKLAPEDPR